MISIKELAFAYQEAENVFSGININFPEGFNVIIGPNAAGKTTLIKCIFGVLQPKGSIFLDDKKLATLSTSEKQKIMSYLPQTDDNNVLMTVFETVLLGRLSELGWRVTAEDLNMVSKTLAFMGISDLAERKLNELSGGQQKIVAIAQTLIKKPRLVLMDEPTNSLDLQKQLELCATIKSIIVKEHISFLIILHDINLAARYADYIAVIDKNGRIYNSGDAKTVITEKMLADVYGVNARVFIDVSNVPGVIPLNSLSET